MLERFSDRINELESVVRDIAIDITTGALVERLPPKAIWDKAGERVSKMTALTHELREYLSILRPEKVPTVSGYANSIRERLDKFREILFKESLDPLESSRRALDELRQVLTEVSDFLSLCKEVRLTPSPVIGEILQLKGTRAVGVSEELWARMDRLLELIRSLQTAYRDVLGITSRLEGQIEAVREDYENLLLNFKREKEVSE